MASSLRWSGSSPSAEDCSPTGALGFGAIGENERPHWRQIVDFAATYSICLKPQWGHSTLALAGDDLVTSCSVGEGQYFRLVRTPALPTVRRCDWLLDGWMLPSRSSRLKLPICR